MASQPDKVTCSLVDERDQYSCVKCGAFIDGGSRHHRQLRRSGDHSAANLVLLCGSGTTGCHGWVHANPAASYRLGLMVHSWHDPASVPLTGARGHFTLDREGHLNMMDTEAAVQLRRELGILL